MKRVRWTPICLLEFQRENSDLMVRIMYTIYTRRQPEYIMICYADALNEMCLREAHGVSGKSMEASR